MNWSTQQQAIFEEFRTGTRHVVVVARAGTGKTTTIIEAVRYAPEARILCCAFNKSIATELQNRLASSNPRATAKTLHGIGFGVVCKFWKGLQVDFGSKRANRLAQSVCKPTDPDDIIKLVAKLCTKGREIAPHARTLGDLTDILYEFECQTPDAWDGTGYNDQWIETKALAAMEKAATERPSDNVIDGADMIFLPVRNGWLQKTYDMVVVDEAQDMTMAQLEIAQGVCRGRIVVVGDDRQAIYGFRGADSQSIARLQRELNAVQLGLTVTYRCGSAIVARAQQLVPDFECGAAHTGSVTSIDVNRMLADVNNGDFLLSRTNAPLVASCFGLLRMGKRARIAGRDIAAGLKIVLRKLSKGCPDIEGMMVRIEAWGEREVRRFMIAEREKQAEQAKDKAETLLVIAQESNSISDMEARIDGLFTDDGLGQAGIITCSSVHRSKGLEAHRVFVLGDTLRGDSQEELNIQYVAITRAKHELVFAYAPKA
jgi:superfamily I DNA/RNA helicase